MSSHHEDSGSVRSDAFRWLFGAGSAAVALSIFLAVTDYRLSHSTVEQRLGKTLLELRSAQASLPSRVTDERQLLGIASGQGRETAGVPQEKSGDSHH